ncbi:MAG: Hpt domain-containing protein [Ruminococcus sp.]|nr:Hpt domain-containing protein [Ruminococcus sp.]
MTIEALRAYGADVDDGLARCMNMEDFYLRLVNTLCGDTKLGELEQALGRHDLDAAFELAHALKGMYANLSLTPLSVPVSEMTELLRARTDTDYSALLAQLKAEFERLRALQ